MAGRLVGPERVGSGGLGTDIACEGAAVEHTPAA